MRYPPFRIILILLSIYCLSFFLQCATEETQAGQLRQLQEDSQEEPKEKIITTKRMSTITIDYYEGKIYVARYTHFLKNHPRYNKYSGRAAFYKKNPQVKAWINRKREVAIVYYGDSRYDCSFFRYKYTSCRAVQKRLIYWEKRLEIKRRVEEAGGEY
jgi:hypothetical protein